MEQFELSVFVKRTKERKKSMKKKKPNPYLIDDENPEWTKGMFEAAQPAYVALPKILGEKMAGELLRSRGRPRKTKPKVSTTLRLDPDIVKRFRKGGPGWQTRINAALREWMEQHPQG